MTYELLLKHQNHVIKSVGYGMGLLDKDGRPNPLPLTLMLECQTCDTVLMQAHDPSVVLTSRRG